MVIEVKMPALSPTMKEGTVAKWLKKEGDEIEIGDVIAEIETDKALIEFESLEEGTLGKIIYGDGSENVAVGTPIALILEEDESSDELDSYTVTSSGSSAQEEPSSPINTAQDGAVDNVKSNNNIKSVAAQEDRKCITPVARRIAENNDINVNEISGSGPRGRVVKADVEGALSKGTKSPQSISNTDISFDNVQEVRPMSKMRKIIASRLHESKSTIPHFYVDMDIDITEVINLRKHLKDNKEFSSSNITLNDILVKATATALQQCPQLNCFWSDEGIVYNTRSDIGVAISVSDGLFVPVLEGVERMRLSEVSKNIKAYAEKAKQGKLSAKDLSGGTISISNLGMMGVRGFSAIVNPPHASILSIGGIQEVLRKDSDGDFSEKQIINIGISADHRIIDGLDAARFLRSLKSILENPLTIAF